MFYNKLLGCQAFADLHLHKGAEAFSPQAIEMNIILSVFDLEGRTHLQDPKMDLPRQGPTRSMLRASGARRAHDQPSLHACEKLLLDFGQRE